MPGRTQGRMRETLGKRIRHLEHKPVAGRASNEPPLPLRSQPDAQVASTAGVTGIPALQVRSFASSRSGDENYLRAASALMSSGTSKVFGSIGALSSMFDTVMVKL